VGESSKRSGLGSPRRKPKVAVFLHGRSFPATEKTGNLNEPSIPGKKKRFLWETRNQKHPTLGGPKNRPGGRKA